MNSVTVLGSVSISKLENNLDKQITVLMCFINFNLLFILEENLSNMLFFFMQILSYDGTSGLQKTASK